MADRPSAGGALRRVHFLLLGGTKSEGLSRPKGTGAVKELDPIPQFKATAKLGEFLDARFSQSF